MTWVFQMKIIQYDKVPIFSSCGVDNTGKNWTVYLYIKKLKSKTSRLLFLLVLLWSELLLLYVMNMKSPRNLLDIFKVSQWNKAMLTRKISEWRYNQFWTTSGRCLCFCCWSLKYSDFLNIQYIVVLSLCMCSKLMIKTR